MSSVILHPSWYAGFVWVAMWTQYGQCNPFVQRWTGPYPYRTKSRLLLSLLEIWQYLEKDQIPILPSQLSFAAVTRTKDACWTFLYHFHRCAPCRCVLGRAWKSSQGCPVAGVTRNCNSEKEREERDQIWDGYLTVTGQLPYMTAECMCWLTFSLKEWFVKLGRVEKPLPLEMATAQNSSRELRVYAQQQL